MRQIRLMKHAKVENNLKKEAYNLEFVKSDKEPDLIVNLVR